MAIQNITTLAVVPSYSLSAMRNALAAGSLLLDHPRQWQRVKVIRSLSVFALHLLYKLIVSAYKTGP
jgi:uncharacterized protein involved in response to NO